MPIINAFNDIDDKPLPQTEGIGGFDDFRRVAAIQVGTGSRAFKADQDGIFLGANKFADAPFSVDMEGNVTATSLDLSAYLSKTGVDQPLTGDIRVGTGANVKIDGANARIIINDGSNDRILIGFQSGGF